MAHRLQHHPASRDVLAAGDRHQHQPLGVRDNYTSLAWLGGSVALDRLNRPDERDRPVRRYGQGGTSLQVQTKGNYWAGRAALAAGHFQEANGYFQRPRPIPSCSTASSRSSGSAGRSRRRPRRCRNT